MKCLVTGGAGFIGSHLCEALAKDHEVYCLDSLLTGKKENIQNPKIKFIKADVLDKKGLEYIFDKNGFDWVFHYAAIVGVKRTLGNPLGVLEDIHGIEHVLDLSRKHEVKKVLFASSSEVYGQPVEIPEREDGHLNAKMPYAVTKLFGENLLKAYYEKYGLRTTSLRFFNVYGPRQDSSDYGFVVGIFIKQVLNNERPTIFGNGSQTRDFVYINDNIEATIKAMESEKTDGEVINIGTGVPVSILHLAERIIELCGKDLKPGYMENHREDIKHRFPDVSKMIELIEFRPRYNLEKGLKETIAWYQNGR